MFRIFYSIMKHLIHINNNFIAMIISEIIIVIIAYLFITLLIIYKNKIENKASHTVYYLLVTSYIILVLTQLYHIDVGYKINNYDLYKSIIELISILFSFFSIILDSYIIRKHSIRAKYIRYLRTKGIIRMSSFYSMIFFIYLSLIVVNFKLIPQELPLSIGNKFLMIMDVIPVLIVQISFILSIFKVGSTINSRYQQKVADLHILHESIRQFNKHIK